MRTSDSAALRMEMIAAVVMDGQVQADATLLKQGHTDRAKIQSSTQHASNALGHNALGEKNAAITPTRRGQRRAKPKQEHDAAVGTMFLVLCGCWTKTGMKDREWRPQTSQ